MKVEVLTTHDGIDLKVGYTGADSKRDWIVLIIPFGLELPMAKPFFDFFSGHYNVVSWEARSILDRSERPVARDELKVTKHAMDLKELLDARQIRQASLVGYCSGAGVALSAVNRWPHRFSSLVLAHGEYILLEEPDCTTQFASDIDSLLSMATGSEETAKTVFGKIRDQRLADGPDIPEGVDMPFSELRYFRRYANNYLEYKSVDFQRLAQTTTLPTLMLTGRRDVQANVSSTELIAQLVPNVDLYIDPESDHYGLLRERSTAMVQIWNYLSEQALLCA
jgi:pimeloyl-ACP methyl ester carboxylesterase